MATHRDTEGAGAPRGRQQLEREDRAQRQADKPSTQVTRSTGPAMMFTPFSLMRMMFDAMERVAGIGAEDQEDQNQPQPQSTVPDWAPLIEVTRREDALVVDADLPGLARENIEIAILDDALLIEGERLAPPDANVYSERGYGRFRRLVKLPQGAKTDAITARLDNGVLEIVIPLEPEHRRTIDVRGQADASPPAQEKPAQPQASTRGATP